MVVWFKIASADRVEKNILIGRISSGSIVAKGFFNPAPLGGGNVICGGGRDTPGGGRVIPGWPPGTILHGGKVGPEIPGGNGLPVGRGLVVSSLPNFPVVGGTIVPVGGTMVVPVCIGMQGIWVVWALAKEILFFKINFAQINIQKAYPQT